MWRSAVAYRTMRVQASSEEEAKKTAIDLAVYEDFANADEDVDYGVDLVEQEIKGNLQPKYLLTSREIDDTIQLVREYREDPNCYPELWISNASPKLSAQEKQLFIELTTQDFSYPFSEGDTYYTIEGIAVVESVWDAESVKLHHKDKKYYRTKMEAYKALELTEDDLRDIAIRITDKLVQIEMIPNCIDTDDETEFVVQDAILEILKKTKKY